MDDKKMFERDNSFGSNFLEHSKAFQDFLAEKEKQHLRRSQIKDRWLAPATFIVCLLTLIVTVITLLYKC